MLLAWTVGWETTAAQQRDKPNILFMLNDNTGYGDIGVYGGGRVAARQHRVSTAWHPKASG